MKLIDEFKEFAIKGNVVDLAVGVAIGGAFNKIVTSLVGDVIMPLTGIVAGHVDFDDLVLNCSETISIKYGLFIKSVVDFLIVSIAIFITIKIINKLKRNHAEKEPPTISTEVELLTEIRDILKKTE